MSIKDPFTLRIIVNAAMSLQLNYLECLINQVGRSRNKMHPEFIRYDASVDIDNPNQLDKCNWALNLLFFSAATSFLFRMTVRPCSHVTFFSPFLTAAPLIYLTYFNVMCEQHHSNSFNPF